jgi:hypothetical protein
MLLFESHAMKAAVVCWMVATALYTTGFGIFAGVSRIAGIAVLTAASIAMALGFSRAKNAAAAVRRRRRR